MTDNPLNLTFDDTITDEWQERDRSYLILYKKDEDGGFGESIAEWWDEAYVQAIEDGFLDRRNLHASAFEYALQAGLLNPANRASGKEPVLTGWVIVHETDGALMTWRDGGQMVWSSFADASDIERGAVTFSDEATAADFFAEDVEGEELADNEAFLAELTYHEVEIDVTPNGHVRPRRASAAQLASIGVSIAAPSVPV
ncbi:hypothetical protein G6L37_02615 [Agrobacterium rubi]|nr:hypothetical protein [Agrobacterium rubi]NTF24289.1 hypothetical protein [Agrobacterium rubi]